MNAISAGLVLSSLILCGCSGSRAQTPRFAIGSGANGDVMVPVSSVIDRRFATVVRQRYDFSCGSAALATLLRYHYGYNVAEESAFRGMWAAGDRAQIRKLGFSLLDMKRWLASRGLRADGYKVSLGQIETSGIPGIALIRVKDYRHFVVVKGVREKEVLIGDPSSGLTAMSRSRFEAAWNGIYFVLADDRARAKSSFNSRLQWAGYTRAPVHGSFADPISLQALALTSPFYRDF
ncbi:C39 family peptidase [Sphingomonas sp. JC676]|uniref:C39 family peptidase n=1 Tax=Sphingomonas sp. JC676 TaxID=2768065 RepID=UPI00165842A6|nr:C39 family peptidase [Sphingomonas sp. JC676]MBC9033916.1 C39 family peptidase [Sphingomonas sp. JC676]